MNRVPCGQKVLRTASRLATFIMIQLMSHDSISAAVPLVEMVRVDGGNSRPVDVVTAPDGSLWFTDPGSERVGQITSNGAIFSIPLESESGPTKIAIGEEGDLWVTLNDANAILRIALTSRQVIDEYSLPSEAAQPFAIAAADGGGIWFTEIGANSIARLFPSGELEEFPIPSDLAVPAGITATNDRVWFTEFNRNRIGRLDDDGSMTEIQLPNPGSAPFDIVAADSGVWFTELNGNRIGHIDLEGVLTEIDVATPASQPAGITVGPDNGIWFTQINADGIGRVVGEEALELTVGSGVFEGGTLFGGGVVASPFNTLVFAASASGAVGIIELCVSDSDCTSGNCETIPTTGVCAPVRTALPTPTITPTAVVSTPTVSSTPPPSLTPPLTIAPNPTSTRTATAARSVPRSPEATSTETAVGNGGGGCTIRSGSDGWTISWWSVLPLVLLRLARRRRSGLLAVGICGFLFVPPLPSYGLVGGEGEEPTATSSAEPTLTPIPTSTATTSATRAATATPHLVEIRIGDTIAGPGDAAHVPVSLSATNASAAAVASEFAFPSDILMLNPARCLLNPAINKSLRADMVSDEDGIGTVRVVVQSSRNVDPIPSGVLYTCTFLVSSLALPGTYAVDSGLTVAFAADGTEIRNVRGTSGEVTVSLIGAPCMGDCDGSGGVTVDEVLSGVSIALGLQGLGACPQFDGDASGGITVDELLAAVNNALNGCVLPPPPPPTPTPTSPPPRTPIFVRVTGNDAYSGLTPARALRTISQAAQIVPAGYRIVVGPGLYMDGVTTDGQGGTPENIVFFADVTGAETGDVPGPVIIDATDSPIASGFRLTKSAKTVIDGFTITGANDAGIVIKSDSDDFVIRNCTVFENPGAGIRVQDSARALVFNNLIYDNGREGIAIVGEGSGSPDAMVLNNTVFGNADRALRVGTSRRGSPGTLVSNNIFQKNGIGFIPPLENVKVFPSSEPGYQGDFNLVFPPTYLPFDLAGGRDIEADAEFVSAAGEDFRLSFGSLAIDAGTELAADLEAALSVRSTTGTNLDDGPVDLGYHFLP